MVGSGASVFYVNFWVERKFVLHLPTGIRRKRKWSMYHALDFFDNRSTKTRTNELTNESFPASMILSFGGSWLAASLLVSYLFVYFEESIKTCTNQQEKKNKPTL